MKTLVLVFHPNLSDSRLNRRWAKEMDKQTDVTVHRGWPCGKYSMFYATT